MFTVYLIPYLTSELGFTVSQVSLVLLAGPLSGLTAAPVMGVLSDRSGRRLGLFTTGCVAMAACQIVLAWSRDIVGGDPAAARWLSAAAVYMGCISARASIVGHRAMAIDNIPPRQQPVFNLASGLMSASGAIATLAVGLVRPSFRAITAICVVSITLSIFPCGPSASRVGRIADPLSGERVPASGRCRPSCRFHGRRGTRHDIFPPESAAHAKSRSCPNVATRGEGSEAVAPEISARAGVRVLLIAEVGAVLLQMTVVRFWDASSTSASPLRRFMDEDMVALRRVWALAFAALGVSTLAAVVFRASFAAASICAVSIMTISPLSVWVPFTIISYEAALVHGEKDGDPSTPWGSSATFFSLHEMAITVGQGLAVLMSGVISFELEHMVTGARNTTAFLFPPAVVAAMVAALLC
ncbi:uncharacterized protein ColSpa_11953 [Colletotrichum spaethianum]|uniref:Major facilitator superfamily associated domain-containing protein n=1 Tax=Colletotrichum spaethianum TaxID=700344 RepID=A0AA37PGG1_9PEZI|nr:uncharacterized protein ColSpa_11953 [Colletotrichum spaethianum]GKT51772.1 hypothetical protein ColSpa_11953 [Colletotrichum spaethianum]